ncbi:MAG: cystathionine beta-synthase [Bdellovibrio sp. CG10_big_fil_rev_8_21_14_0_10_47_8]|nr:MAG: cystathionine beta-synthase [Bdellovibrio sp. CG10_big_fil_rev_8_21_14_0_10_47_8]
MKNVYSNIIDAIGNTPLIRMNRVVGETPHTFWAKVEYFNPGGSVKDRIAVEILDQAEKKGLLKPGGTIVEATSGNTGLGLAMVAAVRGYRCIFVMPDKISEEKRAILRAYGAEVIITPSAVELEDPRSYWSVTKRLTEETPNSFCTNQYHNPDNPHRHYHSTGPEIWQQTDGKTDVFVAGAGTGGTISGVGRYLKEKNKDTKIVLADPVGSVLCDVYKHQKIVIPPKPYKVEGVGEDMGPESPLFPKNIHFNVVDQAISIDDKTAFQMTRKIISQEGLCVGPSSGMALAAAMEYSKSLTKPSQIVVLFPDGGRAYMSKVFNDQWMKENGLL